MKKTVLITGALGNLGLMCVQQALQQGYKVRGLDLDSANNRKLAATLSHEVEILFGDINDESLLEKAIQGVDAIIHNVSLLPPMTETQPELAYKINVTATQRLIALAERQDTPPLLVYPSSFTVFAEKSNKFHIYTPEDEVKSSDNYTGHKLIIENALKQSCLPWVIVRIGVSVDARTLKTDKATFAKLLKVKADNPMEYVHPKDVALAMCNAVKAKEAQGKVLLLGGGKDCQITQHDFLSIAFSAFGLKLDKSVHGDDYFYTHWLDTTESQRILQFQQHTIEEYRQEMMDKVKTIRLFVKPLSFFINPILPAVLKRL